MVISVKIGHLQVRGLKLSLNNSDVQISLSDLDVVLIPKTPQKEQKIDKEKKQPVKKKQEEEFGIINNIINRIIGNMQVDIKRVCVRVLLGHFDENDSKTDIPTLLFRLDQLWLGK